MRKKMLVAVISASTVLVSGCIDSEKVTGLHIKDTCNETDSLRSVELVEQIVIRSANMLGITSNKVLSQVPASVQRQITWAGDVAYLHLIAS